MGHSMHVELLDTPHDAELTVFLDALGRTPTGYLVLGYHYPENREMLKRVIPGSQACWFAARGSSGEIEAVLPGMFTAAGGLACYNSLPFFGPNVGILARPEDPKRYAELAGALTTAALEFARQQGALTAVFYSAFNPHGIPLPNPALDGRKDVLRIPRTTQYLAFPSGQKPAWDSALRRN
jgi:hypothetical protein